MSDDSYSTILTEQIGRVQRITLNRPGKRNALSIEMQDEIVDAVRAAERSPETRAIIIRGAGPSFCAGGDMSWRTTDVEPPPMTLDEDIASLRDIRDRWVRLWDCQIPVIAQIHGYCVGVGTDLALHCDLLIAADDAQIGFPPVRAQGGPPTHMWVYQAGPQWSKRLLLTGDLVSGAKAAEIGLVLESVPASDLDDHVLTLATRMAAIGRGLLTHNKSIVNLGIELMGRSQLQVMAAIHDAMAHQAPEAAEFHRVARAEGVRAAIDARDAPFK